MTGVGQLAVWLFGIFCASVTFCSVGKSLTVRSVVESVAKVKRATREDIR